MNIFIRSVDGKKDSFEVQEITPIETLKQMFGATRGVDPDLVRLIYKGQILEDTRVLAEYKVEPEDCIIGMIIKKKPEGVQQPPPQVPVANHEVAPLNVNNDEHPPHLVDDDHGGDYQEQEIGIGEFVQMMEAAEGVPPQLQELIQQLAAHPEFVAAMMNPQGGQAEEPADGPQGGQVGGQAGEPDEVQVDQGGNIQLTVDEDASINMLCESGGFERDDVLAMFIAMERDINRTADAMFQAP